MTASTAPALSLSDALVAELTEAIHTANLGRSAANAAEPYVHADYEAHEQRLYRLVAVLADGDEDVEARFNEALFDITHDGLGHLRRVHADIVAEVAAERHNDAVAKVYDAAYDFAYDYGNDDRPAVVAHARAAARQAVLAEFGEDELLAAEERGTI